MVVDAKEIVDCDIGIELVGILWWRIIFLRLSSPFKLFAMWWWRDGLSGRMDDLEDVWWLLVLPLPPPILKNLANGKCDCLDLDEDGPFDVWPSQYGWWWLDDLATVRQPKLWCDDTLDEVDVDDESTVDVGVGGACRWCGNINKLLLLYLLGWLLLMHLLSGTSRAVLLGGGLM